MKNAIAIILLFCSLSALADQQSLVALSCSGSNGLRLKLDSSSDIVETKLGIFTKNFETNRTVFLYESNGKSVARVALGLVNASNAYVYDIYLAGHPTKGQNNTMKGVIGHTVYNVVFAPGGGPVPLPIGFVPSTSLNCVLSTE